MTKRRKRLILVAGNIGAGKTSLTQMLGEKLGWQMGFEKVDNPYLGRFYKDMAAWAFHLFCWLINCLGKQRLLCRLISPGSFRLRKDMAAWAFHLQVFHLGHRSEQMIAASAAAESFIMDRSLYEDFHIFTRALRQLGNISKDDYDTYENVYRLVVENLPKPDLLLYLRAPVKALQEKKSP